jgi:hypothetical protein
MTFARSIFVTCYLCAQLFATHALELQIGQNFIGSTFGVDSTATPPNADGWIGPDHFVEIVNGHYKVFNKASGGLDVSMADLDFWSSAGVTLDANVRVSDPRVVYDPLSARWFTTAMDVANSNDFPENRFLLAVSKTSNPLDGWAGIKFDPDPDGNHFSDYPRLGIDANGVYFAANLFTLGGTSLVGEIALSVPKVDLLGVTPSLANLSSFSILSSTRGVSLQPALNFDGTSTGEHLLAARTLTFGSTLLGSTITNAATPQATIEPGVVVSVPPYSKKQAATQPDGSASLNLNDVRFASAVYEVGGVLFAAHHVVSGAHSAVRWYRIDAATLTLLETGLIADPNADLFFPSIAANKDGVTVIGFNKSSTTEFASSYAVVGETIAGVTTFGTPELLAAGADHLPHPADEWPEPLGRLQHDQRRSE